VTIASRIINRCSRPSGASRHELTSHLFDAVQRPEARQCLDELVDAGLVLRFTRPACGGRGQPAKQYFTDAECGAKWAAAVAVVPRHAPQPKSTYRAKPITISDKRRHAGVFLPPGPVRSTVLPADAPVIVPANVKRTVCPSHAYDSRYQIDPSTRVVGGFASAGIGRYLDNQP
jgi:hypothetical protein